MDLVKELERIKKDSVATKCFDSGFFNVCPLTDLHGIWYVYPNKSLLHKFHCIHFNELTDEIINELRALVEEAAQSKKKWWKIL